MSRPWAADAWIRFRMSPTDPTSHDSAVAALMRRVAAAAGVHMYEMELHDDGSYVCTVWISTALHSLLGGVPDGIGDEEAWEHCIHPDDGDANEPATRRFGRAWPPR